MSNTICIKHGSEVPGKGVLQPYELGYVTSTGMLVIGDLDGTAKEIDYLPITGGVIDGNLRINGYLILELQRGGGGLNIWEEHENGFSGILMNSFDIDLYAEFQGNITNWERGIKFHFKDYLGSIAMAGNYDQVDCVFVGKSANEAWLKVIPNVGIQTDSIILSPYDVNTGKGSCGYVNPNEANIPGVPGQLYLVITE